MLNHPGRVRRLDRILAQLPDCRVLIASGNPKLLDPIRSNETPWIQYLEDVPIKVLLTTRDQNSWGRQEMILISQSFAVLPATLDGISLIGKQIELLFSDYGYAEPHIPATLDFGIAIPEILTLNVDHWCHGAQFSETELDELCLELQFYFGMAKNRFGYEWLCASAVFPSLHWNITVYLGGCISAFHNGRRPTHDNLLMLARLPWFRHGSIPVAVRRRLLAELSPKLKDYLQQSILKLIAVALFDTDSTITQAPSKPLSKIDNRNAQLFLDHLSADSEMYDGVFLSFARGQVEPREPPETKRQARTRTESIWMAREVIAPVTVALVIAYFAYGNAIPIANYFNFQTQQSSSLMDAVNDHLRWVNEDTSGGKQLNLSGLSIEDADLSRYHFKSVDFSGATFTNVSFKGTSFNNANLKGTRFIKSDLSFAGFVLSSLDNSIFDSVSLQRAIFTASTSDNGQTE